MIFYQKNKFDPFIIIVIEVIRDVDIKNFLSLINEYDGKQNKIKENEANVLFN